MMQGVQIVVEEKKGEKPAVFNNDSPAVAVLMRLMFKKGAHLEQGYAAITGKQIGCRRYLTKYRKP